MTEIKLVVIGDSSIGKSSLLLTYQHNVFPDPESTPSICDSFTVNRDVDGHSVVLTVFESGRGNDSYDPMRALLYTNTRVFIVCFAVDDRSSFENVTERWIPELQHHCPEVPLILCGLKGDSRDDADNPLHMVGETEARSLVSDIGAAQYIELSSLLHTNVQRVFEDAIRLVIHGRLQLAIDDGADADVAAGGAAAAQREPFTCDCEIDWNGVMNQSWMALTFVFALGLYILLDIFSLVVAVNQYGTSDECWTALSSPQHTLWIHPRTFLIAGSTVSLVAVCLGMCFKALFGVDEEQQDWPRLCILIFFFSWCIAGYVLCAQIYNIPDCHGQSVGKMCIAWTVIKMFECCCGTLDITVNFGIYLSQRR